jgi:succinoglycan biosynthesis protein ExoA
MEGTETSPELVTVVIPARNEERSILRCLQSVQGQTYRNLQIVVVDGASDDRTAEIVKEVAEADGRIELLVNPDRVIPKSLNLAAVHARGRWLVRVDAHSTVPPDYVMRAAEHLRTGRWAGVGGRKDGVAATPAGKAVAAAMASRFGVGNSTYHYGVRTQVVEHVPFGAYPLDVVRWLGGWDERLTVNQDFEFDERVRAAGGQILFDPDLVIHWECRQSVGELFGQYRRYGRGKVRVARLHPRSVRLRHLAAPGLVAAGAVAAVASVRRPRAAAIATGPYLAALAVASVRTARSLEPAARPWVAPAFVAMHVGWGLGFWEGVAAWLTGSRARSARPADEGSVMRRWWR